MMALKKGTNLNDSLTGTAKADLIFGLLGNDILRGLAGDDRIYGANGNDRLDGGAGNDLLYGGLGADKLYGGAGADVIDTGGQLLFSLSGETSVDFVDAGAGNDQVTIERNDAALGGSGKDVLHLRDSEFAVTKNVELDFSKIGSATAKAIGKAGTFYASTKVGQFESVIYFGSAVEAGSKIIGSKGDDVLTLSISSIGSGPGVSISGGAGNDVITGSNLADTLVGGAGNDMLTGDLGLDKLTGGAGNDIFVINTAFSLAPADADQFVDFKVADDMIAVGVSQGSTFGPANQILHKAAGASNATTASGVEQFVYDTTSGKLYLDINGSDADGMQLLATLVNKANITASNISLEFSDFIIA